MFFHLMAESSSISSANSGVDVNHEKDWHRKKISKDGNVEKERPRNWFSLHFFSLSGFHYHYTTTTASMTTRATSNNKATLLLPGTTIATTATAPTILLQQ